MKKKPNLLYVFPDQFRLMSLGIWQQAQYQTLLAGKGDPVITPNLDAFAQHATLLPNAVSNCPVCSPHRGSLMTGQFPAKSGVPLNCNSQRVQSELPQTAFCFTDALAQAGYDVGYIGKWHLDLPTANDPINPGRYVDPNRPAWDSYTEPQRRHGIHYWYGYGTFDQHCNPHYYDTLGNRYEPRKWSAEHEADKAISYLQNQQNQRDSNKPFALFVSMNPPHSPYSSLQDCREEDWQHYQHRDAEQLLVRDNADARMDKANSAAYYFANVTGVDKEFGRIVDALKKIGEWDNTVIVFTSDHGETLCSHALEDAKNCIYNEAFSVPFLLKTAQQKESKHHPAFLSSADIMPTLLATMGLQETWPDDIDGRDLSSALLDPANFTSFPDCALYLRNVDGPTDQDGKVNDYFPISRGIKTASHTLALEIDGNYHLSRSLLFDDQQDPYQMNNLPFQPDSPTVRRLLRALAEELVRTEDPWASQQVLGHLLPYDLFSNKG
ncbi:sulfatase family protein [Vibrio sp. TRT 21S02]|uniref:sulfatase family protein n=1 Tax=Vibrio sp. TRT 21S02 TaxID=3418507 RepID=UPI003CF86A46